MNASDDLEIQSRESAVSKQDIERIYQVLTSDFEQQNLTTFVIVARYLSFKAAAKHLCLSSGAVSHRILHLEQELGFSLFNRMTRAISLTPEGSLLLHVYEQAQAALRQEIRTSLSFGFGSLTVYSHPSFAHLWLIRHLREFRDDYPDVHINIRTGNSPLDFLVDPQVDLALYYADEPMSGLECASFMGERTFPVCSPDYADKLGLMGNPAALQEACLLHDSAAWHYSNITFEWNTWFKIAGLEQPANAKTMSFDTSMASLEAATLGHGVAMGRQNLAQHYLDEGLLVAPFGTDVAIENDQAYWAVWPKGKQQSPYVRAFFEWLRSYAPGA